MALDKLALNGVRVLDFTWVMAGPLAGHMLADLGAEVIKLESRGKLDAQRRHRPIPMPGATVEAGDKGELPEMIPFFHILNRNKRGITLNLKHPKGIPLVKELVKICDVVIDNYTPGTMKKLGLDYSLLHEINPRVITVALSGPGGSGPYVDMVAYAPLMTAMAGMDELVGYDGEEPLGAVSLNIGDVNLALAGFVGTMAALLYRCESGRGQHVDVCGIEAMVACLGEPIMEYVMNNRVPKPKGNFHPYGAPYGIYRCQGEDDWISIAAITDEDWRKLVSVMGEPSWASEKRFSSRFDRVKNRRELDGLIEEWTKGYERRDLEGKLMEAGIAAGIAANVADQFIDPHLRARGAYVEIEHPVVGTEIVYGNPIKMSETPTGVRKAAPLLGQDNHYVYGELLGLSDAEIASMEKEGVFF